MGMVMVMLTSQVNLRRETWRENSTSFPVSQDILARRVAIPKENAMTVDEPKTAPELFWANYRHSGPYPFLELGKCRPR